MATQSGETSDPYALLRASHPFFKTATSENLGQLISMVGVWQRQLEIDRDDAIISDPFIQPLAQELGEAVLHFFPAFGTNLDSASYSILRAYCADTALRRIRPAISQVVMIANGVDTRAFRMDEIENCSVFELHLNPTIMAHKEKVFADLGAKCKGKNRTAFLTHFHDDTWQEDLQNHGFDPKKPTFWILESTLHFIDPAEVMPLLRGIDALSAPGSQMITERILGGGVDLDLDEEQGVELLVYKGLRYGEDGGVFCELQWHVELLMRRNQACEYYGTMWDAQRFNRLRILDDEATLGPWFMVLFTKPG